MAGRPSNRAFAVLLDGPRCDACVSRDARIDTSRVSRHVTPWVRRGSVARAPGVCPACGATRLVSRVTFGSAADRRLLFAALKLAGDVPG